LSTGFFAYCCNNSLFYYIIVALKIINNGNPGDQAAVIDYESTGTLRLCAGPEQPAEMSLP